MHCCEELEGKHDGMHGPSQYGYIAGVKPCKIDVYLNLGTIMISEKTVELNLTTELINWFGSVTGTPHFALAPSQRQEGMLGFDVAIGGGIGVLIQYKRAYVDGNIWRWHLNRTTLKDQHARLQALEMLGVPVFYAFPYFQLPSEVRTYRRRLLLKTYWFKPSQINPTGGPNGHHDVIFNAATGAWSVHSEVPTELSDPLSIDAVASELDRQDREENMDGLMRAFNSTVLEINPNTRPDSPLPRSLKLDDLVQGVAVIGKHHV